MQEAEIAAALGRIAASLEASGAPGADVAALMRYALDEQLAIHALAGQLVEVAHEQREQLAAISVQIAAYSNATVDERIAIDLLLRSLAETMRTQVRAQEDLARAVASDVTSRPA